MAILKRRIANLEQRWPRRISLIQLLRDAENLARLTEISFDEARDCLLADVSAEDVERMLAEAEAVVGRVAAGKKEKASASSNLVSTVGQVTKTYTDDEGHQ